jgi:serine/threonine-protein kinase
VTAARLTQVDRLYHAARERPAHERAPFIRASCGGDTELQDEVLSLLAYDAEADEFLERPALEEAARRLQEYGPEPLTDRRLGHYQIVSLLGSGGMGDVYRARDLTLGRDVALKLLSASLVGDPEYARRFDEEARSASGLNHPCIVTIHGVGQDGGVSYIAMELVHGRTLREYLAAGAIPLGTALDLALQLADALAAAHEAGIVHRDLKPDNVMVTPAGLLKVLDFGIAKRERDPSSVAGAVDRVQQTSPGTILGTAGYMSPEQALGQPADRASDQFSFGAIFYELLAGRRAFEGATRMATLEAILRDQPPPIEHLAPIVGPRVQQLLNRTLAKDPQARYAVTADMAAEVRQIRDIAAGAIRATPISRRRAIGIGAAAVVGITAGLTGAWKYRSRDTGIRSLAVLPFVSDGADPSMDVLCDGLTESLIRRLSLAPLKVMARSTVFTFKGRSVDPLGAGRSMQADAVLTGSVRRLPGRLQIGAELVEVGTGARLWAHTYDRAASDVLIVQEEMARAIIDDGIRVRLSAADRAHLSRGATSDPVAYDLYVRALAHLRRDTEEDYLAAQDLLHQAVTRDAAFALAYAALATTYSVMTVDGYLRPNHGWTQSVRFAQRAIALEHDLADGHAELASYQFYFNWDWASAEREWEAVLQLRGDNVEPDLLIAYAMQRWATGRPDLALDLARQARSLDRLNPLWTLKEADFLVQNQQPAAAAALYERLTHEAPGEPRALVGLADVRRRQGRFDEAVTALAEAQARRGNPGVRRALGDARGEEAYRRLQEMTAALQLDDLVARAASGAYVSPMDFARAHAQRGDAASALRYFPAAFDDLAPDLVFLKVDPVWDPLRDAPPFRAAMARVGLPG